MKQITIAIDGPAGSGKSTTAKIAAKKLNYIYIDTGAMYRAVTVAWLRSRQELDEKIICAQMDSINIELKIIDGEQRTYLNGEDVSVEIRLPEVTKYVSPVSAIPCVREKLVALQRKLGENGGVILDGRDIGTVVFPNAELKIFLIASIEARAERRAKELREKGIDFSLAEMQKQLADRDNFDSTRSHSPLSKANDAIEIDTSELTIEQQTDLVCKLALEIIEG